MSKLASQTAPKALKVLARSLRLFDQLALLDMTAEDDRDAWAARNLISKVIESNGVRRNNYKGRTKLVAAPEEKSIANIKIKQL